MTSLTGRPVMQKQPRIEVPSILVMIRAFPCFATVPHRCEEYLGCVPAHGNWLELGKGVGKKTSDHIVASVCHVAHALIDGHTGLDTLSEDQRRYYWLEAYIATWDYAWREGFVIVVRKK
jgi:hypothetical protein